MARYWIDTTRAALAAYNRHDELYRGADVPYPYMASTSPSQRILVQARFCDFGACCLSGANAEADKTTLEAAGFTVIDEADFKTLVAEWFPVRFVHITTQPTNKTGYIGGSATFSVVADDNGTGILTYQWYLNGEPITGATSSSYTKTGIAAYNDGDTYRVRVGNSLSYLTSNTVTLSCGARPEITVQPVGTSIAEGDPFSLSIEATGATSYQWYLDSSSVSGATSATYSKSSASGSDAGTYFCRATNKYGSVDSDDAVLAVDVSTLLLVQVDSSGNIVERTGNGTITTSGTVIVDSTTTHDGYGSIRNTASGSTTASGYTSVSMASVMLSGDFCIEGWLNPLSLSGEQTWFCNQTGSTGLLLSKGSGGNYPTLTCYNGGSITSSIEISEAFTHIAWCRSGETFRLFIGGALAGSDTATAEIYVSGLQLGRGLSGSEYPCCWENVRVSNVARYTSNFTPPARF